MARLGSEWLEHQTALLVEHYPDMRAADLAKIIGRDVISIYHKAVRLGLKKSPEFLKSTSSGLTLESPIGKEFTGENGYLIRKVNNDLPFSRRWRPVHIIVWESHHGPVPKGYMVCFKDGDRKNTSPDNLELLTRRENFMRWTVYRYPKEIVTAMQLLGKLKQTIKRRNENA